MDVTVCQLVIKGFDVSTVELSAKKLKQIASFLGIVDVSGTMPLPTKIKKYTVLRSPFIDKKSREQFETRLQHRLLVFKNTDQDVIENFIQFIQLNVPIGVTITIKRFKYLPFSVK